MLSSGARRLAEHKAVVKSLSDVETLGGTTVINSDKTGTLTMNAMTATTMLGGGDWFKIEGPGYAKTGAILGVAGGEPPDFRNLALGLVLCTDATVGDDGSVIGDPTEAAFVVLAAKMGVDAEQTRQALPRRAEVPFDSEYKFMATFHDRPDWLAGPIVAATASGHRQRRAGRRSWTAATGPCGMASRCRSAPSGTSSWPPTASCPSAGCGCSRSPPRTWMTRRCPRRWPTRWPPSPTWSSSRWSGSWTRCAPRPGTRSAPRWAPGSTCG